MKRARVALAIVMVAVAICWLYLAIVGDGGHSGFRPALWIAMSFGWIGVALVMFRDRRRDV